MRYNIKLFYGVGIIHVALTIISTAICIICFPFLTFIFTQLDIIGCLSGSSLALMAFPEAGTIGFINLKNCVFFFFLCGIVILALIGLLVALIKKRHTAYLLIVGIYIFDLLFLLVHYFFLRNMLDISTQGMYAILSATYKVIGILLYSYLYKKAILTTPK